ncbi:MAG: MarR family transcriptional regulator [Hyphomicrobium sp.]|nr:MAG: MarR family transcriptional regulator [Hyphomicrobium sp.]
MADVSPPSATNDPTAPRAASATHVQDVPGIAGDKLDPIGHDTLMACVELLFFAYRDFTGEPDAVLDQYGFGRAHHRVLHFISRNPGLSVAELLDILKITKQSLARVLKQLVSEGFVTQRAGEQDRRERRLYLTLKGSRLAEKLAALQVQRIETAFRKAGPDGEAATRQFLFAMVADGHRAKVEALIRLPSQLAPRDEIRPPGSGGS